MQIKLSTDTPIAKSSAILSLIFSIVSFMGPELINIWTSMPETMREALPSGVTRIFVSLAFLLTFVARLTVIVRDNKTGTQ